MDPAPPEPHPLPAAPEPASANLPSAGSGRRRFSPWWVLGPLLFLIGVGAVVASFVTAPYIMFAPGSASRTEPLITVPRAHSYAGGGDVLYLTVSVVHPTYMAALWGWLNPDIDVYPYKTIYGTQTSSQNIAEGQADMTQSKVLAAEVALRQLGYSVRETGTGVVVGSVEPSLPAAKSLHPNDVIVGFDGTRVSIDDQLVALIQKHKPGDRVTLSVESGGKGAGQPVTTTLSTRPGTKATPILGVTISTRNESFTLPFPVSVDSGQVGGPSAGLAFTLGVLDRLTPGSITGGKTVAVTGEISPTGQVLDVGGVRQKAVAARRAGAVMMIVPTGEYKDALPMAGHMKVVKVNTLHEALRALATLGGNALKLGKPGAGVKGA